MERINAALIERVGNGVDMAVVAREGLDEVGDMTTAVHVPLAKRPAFLRIAEFWFRGPTKRELRFTGDLVHSCGAITRGGADVVTVHLCHAAAEVSRGANESWRYWNARIARWLGRTMERRTFRPSRVGVLVAVSDAVAAELRAHYPQMPVRVIYNGVDTSYFTRSDRTPTSTLRVLMVTGDFALKGVADAIRALSLATGPVTLTVVGNGPVEQYVALAESLGVANRVRFTGQLNDVRPEYATHDVVLCLSSYESFGLYLVEAALSGCAVLATDVGVAAQLIGENTGGMLIDPKPATLAEQLSRWSGDIATVQALGRVASERAQRFSLERMVGEYESLYRELVEVS